jgi:hypothetical protein
VIIRRVALIVLWSLFSLSSARGEVPPTARVEIEYLLQRVGTSGCEFYRNGSWYDAGRAEAHLRDKYEYLDARHQINSAEDFIDRAATKSSLSGQVYQLRCNGSAAVPSGQWLYDALTLYRRASRR